jgi:DNA-binding phage protein
MTQVARDAGLSRESPIELDGAIDLCGTVHAGDTVGLMLFHGASSRHLTLFRPT